MRFWELIPALDNDGDTPGTGKGTKSQTKKRKRKGKKGKTPKTNKTNG